MDNANLSANYSDQYWNEVSYIASVSVNGALTAITMWFLFTLVHYGVKTGKWSGAQKRNADKLNAGWVYTSVIACAVISIIRYMTSQISFQIGYGVEGFDSTCESINDLLFVEYSLVLFSNYVFLWLRQRTFYTNEMFNISYNKCLSFLSASSIAILFLAGIGVVVINTLPTNYPATPNGCIYDAESEAFDISSWAACAVVLVVGQVLLLSLLIYPLAKNLNDEHCIKQICCFMCAIKQEKKPLKQQQNNAENSPSKTSIGSNEISGHTIVVYSTCDSQSPLRASPPKPKKKTKRKSSVAVKKIMIRTLLFGFIAVFTDLFLIAILSTNLVDHSDPKLRRLSVLLYDINVFLNLALVVMSFMSYKKMLSSPCGKTVTRDDQSSRITASSS